MILNRERLLQPVLPPMELVELPELGGDVYVKGMTVTERTAFERSFQLKSGKQNQRKIGEVRERLLVKCICDEDRNELLTIDDIGAISRQRADVIERLVNTAQRLCGMTDTDVEDLAGNSETTGDNNSQSLLLDKSAV